MKKRYGLWGIIITSPVILSIPVGAFLLKKYYSETKNVFGYMMISIVGWAAFFAVVTIIFPGLV
jgi:polyferredoxin